METYKSEEVIESLVARIHPTDNSVPECRCYIRLTSRHVFISEDNYDGTYEDHYVLDVSQIDEIKISEPYETSMGFTSTSLDKNGVKKSSVSRKRHGALNSNAEAALKKFLEIIYRGNNGKTEHLYFDECSSDPSLLINAFATL